jgi:hypothetical protein
MTLDDIYGRNGWFIKHADVLPGSGLVLKGVSHGPYRLARDMRVVAVWAGTGDPHASDPGAQGVLQKLRLGDSGCPLAPDGALSVNHSPDPPDDFPYHPADFALTATFRTPAQVFPGGTDQLTITQTYQFAPWGLDPPHEPGGILPAARLLPLVKVHCDQVDGRRDPDVRYIRIDYRLNYALQSLDPPATDLYTLASDPLRGLPGTDASNQAGIFRDVEGSPPLLNATVSGIELVVTPLIHSLIHPSTLNQVFAAGEKPLTYEVLGHGLGRGSAYSPTGSTWSWDNSHQWPSSTTGTLPDTPGAFDCCHTHWRWGAATGDLTLNSWPARHLLIPKSGAQFKGYGWSAARGGPLVDHRVHDQTITFAIAVDRGDADKDVSTRFFSDMFTGMPKDISVGAELVQWFSIELFRGADAMQGPWEGTVFIHGIYFAHSQESWKIALRSAAGGLTDSVHNPPEPGGRPWTFNPA